MKFSSFLTACLFLVSAAAATPVEDVLGDAVRWKLWSEPAVVEHEGGVTLTGQANQTLVVESVDLQALPAEFVMQFRMRPATGSCYAMLQLLDAEGKPTLQCSSSATHGGKYASWSAAVLQPEQVSQSGYLFFEAVGDRSLAWPEELRKTLELQIAGAPKMDEVLFSLRCTVQDGRFKVWFNDRFVAELPYDPAMLAAGKVKVQVSPGAELASLRVSEPRVVDRRFEPLALAGYVNSDALGGKSIDTESIPKDVAGVPFEPAQSGGVDVWSSWTRFGALAGYFASHTGTFNGRWTKANRIDPSRIAMYVPRGRYKALHLLAVADDSGDRKIGVPIVTAQFYRPDAGHPFNFATTVPTASDASDRMIDVKLADGSTARLHHVVIPVDPDAFSWFTDLERIGLEITKAVHYYRAYPDPLEYSWHAGGLPSTVRIFAMTLERVGVDVEITPEHYGHFWTAPEKPKYTINLRNTTGAATSATLDITTSSADGKDVTQQTHTVALPATDTPVVVPIELSPTRYGLHELSVTLAAGGESATYRRNFAHLHPDTREKEYWEPGRGPIFGFWSPGGGHDTPPRELEFPLMAAAGAETSLAEFERSSPEVRAMAEEYRFISEAAFSHSVMYYAAFIGDAKAPKWDPNDPDASGQALVEAMRAHKFEPSAFRRPQYVTFFPEPHLGMITCAVWPSHWGEEYELNPSEQKVFETSLAKFLAGARAVRKEWPDVKILLPYGDPAYTAAFLRLSPEARELIDGCGLDLPGFERLPEQQVHQVVLHRMGPIMQDIRQYKSDPFYVLVEGTSISSVDIATGQRGQADIAIRDFLLLMGYGVTRFESSNAPFDCANYWGENHYGGGWCTRKPVSMPKLAYVAYATMTRHLNRANFTRYIPTGSTSTFCQQFQHYKTGERIHVLWAVRGKRTVNVKVAPGTQLELFDLHDNPTTLAESNGVVTFTVDASPQYLRGLTEDAQIILGDSDHSDAAPAALSRKIANLADGWSMVEDEDPDYTKNKPLQIERFLGRMSVKAVDAPEAQGGNALAVHLGEQDRDRGVMPFYTTLRPAEPITIDDKASHLGLWVHAASDWGRVVYVLRDANNEKWISVGTKEDWNNDDIHGWSMFCFDGWRYLRFELPASLPYDCYREHGTAWWGSTEGDGIVDLPLRLEKIFVERRPKVIYGNALVDAKPDDVLLGDLYAEYASEADMGDEAVALSRLRMPVPEGAPELGNPIAALAASGVGEPVTGLSVSDPVHQYDGTRCHVHFEPAAGAASYSVWVSPYPDGRGAVRLASGWTEPGGLIQGLRPDVQFYLFVVYSAQDGTSSKPSQPLAFTLKNRFGYK